MVCSLEPTRSPRVLAALTGVLMLLCPQVVNAQKKAVELFLGTGPTFFLPGKSEFNPNNFKGTGAFAIAAGFNFSQDFKSFEFRTGIELVRDNFRFALYDFGHQDLFEGSVSHTYRYNSITVPFLIGIPIKISSNNYLQPYAGANFGYRALFSVTYDYQYPSPVVALLDTLHYNLPTDPNFGGGFHSRLTAGIRLGKSRPAGKWCLALQYDYHLTLPPRQDYKAYIKYGQVDQHYPAGIQPRLSGLMLMLFMRLGRGG